jgi:hypothetical protein
MSDFITPVEVHAMKAELAALKRENEILYRFLQDQKEQIQELRNMLLGNRGDAK